jgi:hypothetical protein
MPEVVFSVDAGAGCDGGWLDEITGELADDLRAVGGVSVRPVDREGGGKSGTAAAIGELVVSGGGLGVAAWAVRDVVRAFLDRTRADSVTIRRGDRKLVIERPTDAQVDQVLDRLEDLLRDE